MTSGDAAGIAMVLFMGFVVLGFSLSRLSDEIKRLVDHAIKRDKERDMGKK